MTRFLRPRTLIPALGLLAGLLGTAAPAQAQVLSVSAPANAAEGTTTPITTSNRTFTVTAANPGMTDLTNVTFSVNFTVGGEAALNDDFTTPTPNGVLTFSNVTIAAGGSTSLDILVPVRQDNTFEDDEDLTVTLSGPTGGATLGTAAATTVLVNDDTLPVLSINSPSVAEGNVGNTNLTFTVTATNPNESPITVDVVSLVGTATSSASASGNPDYQELNTTITIPANTASTTFNVVVFGDTVLEADETVLARIEDPVNATIAPGGNIGTGTILNDDALPTLSISDVTVCEDDGTATFTVTQSAISGLATTVNVNSFSGSATEGVDFGSVDGTSLTFAPGETVKTVTVSIVNDAFADDTTASFDPETFTLVLSGAANATLADATGVGTILDDEGLIVDIEPISGSTVIGVNGLPEQCFRISVTNQCGDEVGAGQEVVINIQGETGSDRTISVFTNGEGEAEFCYTPLFPGEDDILVSVEVNGVLVGQDVESIRIFLPGNTDARVEGSGYVDTEGYGTAFFSLNATLKRNGRPQGAVTATIPSAAFFGPVVSAALPGSAGAVANFRSTRITAIIAGDAVPGGHAAIVFGTGSVSLGRRRVPVLFRADVLDNGTPGVPNDRFVLTVLGAPLFLGDGNGNLGQAISVGGSLKHARGRGIKNDIRVDFPGFGGGSGPAFRR